MKFRKKPVEIEAVQYDGTDAGYERVCAFAPGVYFEPLGGGQFRVPTLEDGHTASPGDWIIRGVKGELYPCKPDIFEMTYDRADQDPPAVDQIAAAADLATLDKATPECLDKWSAQNPSVHWKDVADRVVELGSAETEENAELAQLAFNIRKPRAGESAKCAYTRLGKDEPLPWPIEANPYRKEQEAGRKHYGVRVKIACDGDSSINSRRVGWIVGSGMLPLAKPLANGLIFEEYKVSWAPGVITKLARDTFIKANGVMQETMIEAYYLELVPEAAEAGAAIPSNHGPSWQIVSTTGPLVERFKVDGGWLYRVGHHPPVFVPGPG